jgi:hypothetical protein
VVTLSPLAPGFPKKQTESKGNMFGDEDQNKRLETIEKNVAALTKQLDAWFTFLNEKWFPYINGLAARLATIEKTNTLQDAKDAQIDAALARLKNPRTTNHTSGNNRTRPKPMTTEEEPDPILDRNPIETELDIIKRTIGFDNFKLSEKPPATSNENSS